MAEYVAVATQEVAANENVTFTNTSVKGSNCIQHREGSGTLLLEVLRISVRPFFCKLLREYSSSGRWNCGSYIISRCYQW